MAWRLRLADRARVDLQLAIAWSRQTFGEAQAERYRKALQAAVDSLRHAPLGTGTRDRADLGPGVRLLHMRRAGQRGRHCLVYRLIEPETVILLRVLHDAMDLARHLPPEGP